MSAAEKFGLFTGIIGLIVDDLALSAVVAAFSSDARTNDQQLLLGTSMHVLTGLMLLYG